MGERAVPILPARDLRATLAFYERLGFASQGAPPEVWDYLIVGRGGIELHFYAEPDVDPLTTAFSCYLRVADADALYREWERIGVEHDPATGSRLIAPVTTDYGMREFALVDPSGNLVRVGSTPAESPEEAKVLALFDALFERATRDRDADAAAELFAPDADVTMWGSDAAEDAVGPEAVRALLGAVAGSPQELAFHWDERRVRFEGAAAWVTASARANAGSRAIPYRAVVVCVVRDGAWRIHTYHGSEPQRS